MNVLKVKLSVFEKRLAMQVIEQDSTLSGSTSDPIEFIASNGIVIASSGRPGLYPELNRVELRGDINLNNLDLVNGRFESTEQATKFCYDVRDALQEFVNSNKEKLYRTLATNNSTINLEVCDLLFSDIKGGFLVQVDNINIPDHYAHENLKKSKRFDITITEGKVNIEIPFQSKESMETLLKMKDATKESLDNFKVEIIKTLLPEVLTMAEDKLENFEITL